MKTILCPTDLSASSTNAIVYAAKMAQAIDGGLTLLHVKTLLDFNTMEMAIGRKTVIEQIREELDEVSDHVMRTFRIPCKVDVDGTSLNLSSGIGKHTSDYDLVIMGTNGADDLYQFFNGSHTYNAALKTKAPLILIPEGCMYSEIKSIVLAFDYLKERQLPFEQIRPFAEKLNAEVIVLQVMEEARSREADADLRELQFILETKWGSSFAYRFDTLYSSETGPAIDSYVKKNQADALAMYVPSRNYLSRLIRESALKHISAVAEYPVLALPGS